MRVLIVGIGGHAVTIADALVAMGDHEFVGFVSDKPAEVNVCGLGKWLGEVSALKRLVDKGEVGAVMIGVGDNSLRMRLQTELRRELGSSLSFPKIMHPSAVLGAGASIGEGAVLLAGSVVGPGAEVGDGCIVNTGASLDHHGEMKAFSSLAPGVVTGGNVAIGEGSAVSIGATVLHGRSIGDWSVVGAGATVVDDVPDGVVAYGTPARVVRTREPGDTYL